ncbi:MAG: cytochrome P450 [Deltaproteobacteria bacterium]|nr:cytochrome P450 [Deltaproteobacteria bacterium]
MSESLTTTAASERRLAPGPKGSFLLGNLGAAREDPIKLFLGAAMEHGDLVRFRFGPRIGHLVRAPEFVRHVMQEHSKNYGKQTPGYRRVQYVLGQGLLTSEGDFWLRQRRIAQPGFHRQRIAGFGETFVRCTQELMVRWQEHVASGKPIDVLYEMMKLTLRVVALTLLSKDLEQDADAIGEAVSDILMNANERMTAMIDIPPHIPTRKNRRFNKFLRVLDDVVLGLIRERRKDTADRGDLLSMLMLAKDEETGETMTDGQLRDEVMTIFLAGHETTANALTWTLMLLSQHPGELRLAQEEVKKLGDRALTAADFPQLTRVRACIDEGMRLYPPAWMVARSVAADDTIGGYHIPGGSICFTSPYVSHRNPNVFDNPLGFDPARFLDGRSERWPRFAYFPFGGGPRLCIGNNFALLEASLILATMLQKVRLELVPGHDTSPEPSITLRPRHGMKMWVKPA